MKFDRLLLKTLGILVSLALTLSVLALAGKEKVYISQRYGYGFHYPTECGLKAVAAGAYVDLFFQGQRLPEVSVQTLDETGKEERKGSPDMWREFMLERAKISCSADGPDGTVYCEKVVKENSWKTSSGLRVLEMYLGKVQEHYGPPHRVKSTEVGPIYAVDISRPGYVFGLLVGSGHDYPRTAAEKDRMKSIVASVYLIPESNFQPPRPNIVGPGPLFERGAGKVLMPAPGK